MRVRVVKKHGCTYIEGVPTDQFIQREEDAVALVGTCGEHSADRLLLYAGNLSENFFDLTSGLAGTILQKFANYHLKVALIISPEIVQGKFKEYVLEANRGTRFHTFEDKDKAELWLASD